MKMLDDILEWVQENPETNRIKLCQFFKDDEDLVYDFTKRHPEYKDFTKHFVTSSFGAYVWACNIGNKEFMKHKITHVTDAVWWAREIGDRECMKQIIVESKREYWIKRWNNEFEDDKI